MPHGATQGKPVDAVGGTAPLLRLDEVAERLAISKSMSWKLVACGHLRAVRIGRAVRIRPDDLEAFIADASRDG